MNAREQTIKKYTNFLNIVKQNEGNSSIITKLVAECGVGSATPRIAQELGLFSINGFKIEKVNYNKAEPIMALRLIEKVNAYAQNKNRPEFFKKQIDKKVISIPDPIQPKYEKVVELRILGIPLFKYTKS